MIPPLIGIDLIEPDRLRTRLETTQELLDELFTAQERAYCFAQRDPYQHLAARFCAKEATAKALGLDGFEPLDVEILSGGPEAELVLHGDAKSRADTLRVDVSASLTHLAALAAAVVVARPRLA